MLAQQYRLTTKDVRYIQKQKNIVWTQHFWFLWIPQYSNRKFHQCSLYIAADTVKKATRRHQLKRQLLSELEWSIHQSESTTFYKIFVFLNKKNILPTMISWDTMQRQKNIAYILYNFKKEWSICRKKLWIW